MPPHITEAFDRGLPAGTGRLPNLPLHGLKLNVFIPSWSKVRSYGSFYAGKFPYNASTPLGVSLRISFTPASLASTSRYPPRSAVFWRGRKSRVINSITLPKHLLSCAIQGPIKCRAFKTSRISFFPRISKSVGYRYPPSASEAKDERFVRSGPEFTQRKSIASPSKTFEIHQAVPITSIRLYPTESNTANHLDGAKSEAGSAGRNASSYPGNLNPSPWLHSECIDIESPEQGQYPALGSTASHFQNGKSRSCIFKSPYFTSS